MNEKINFSDLVEQIAEESGASKKLIRDLLVETIQLNKEDLNSKGYSSFPGLGRFKLIWHDDRIGRNPQTGEDITIRAHNSINYKPEANLRKFINRKYAHLNYEMLKNEVKSKPEEIEEPDFFSAPYEPAPILQDKRERRSLSRLWLLLIPIIVILIILLLPWFRGTDQIQSRKPVLTQTPDATAPDQTEAEQPVEIKQVNNTVPDNPAVNKQRAVEPVAESIPAGMPGSKVLIKQGQTLWSLAQNYYQQSYLWPNIYRVNSASIPNPDLVLIGINVQIPSLQGNPRNLTQQDVEQIAEGYVEVYLTYKRSGKKDALSYLKVVSDWQMNSVIDKYKDRIDDADLIKVKRSKRVVTKL